MDSSILFDDLSDVPEFLDEVRPVLEVPEEESETGEQGPQFMKDFRKRFGKGGKRFKPLPVLAAKFVSEKMPRAKYVKQCRMKKLYFWLESHSQMMIFHPTGARKSMESFTIIDYVSTPIKQTLVPVHNGCAINPFWKNADMVHVAGLIDEVLELQVKVNQRFVPTVKQPEPVIWVEHGERISMHKDIDIESWNADHLVVHNAEHNRNLERLRMVSAQIKTAQVRLIGFSVPDLPVLSTFAFQRLLLELASKGLYGGAHPTVIVRIVIDTETAGLNSGFATIEFNSTTDLFVSQLFVAVDESPGLGRAFVTMSPISDLDRWMMLVVTPPNTPVEQTNSGLYGGSHPRDGEGQLGVSAAAASSSSSSSSSSVARGYEGKQPCSQCGSDRALGRWDPLHPCVLRCVRCHIQLVKPIKMKGPTGRHPEIDELDDEQKREVMVDVDPPVEEKKQVESILSRPLVDDDKPMEIIRRARHDGDRVCDPVLAEAYFSFYGNRYESFDKFDHLLEFDEDQRIVAYTSVKCDLASVVVTRVTPTKRSVANNLLWKRLSIGLYYALVFLVFTLVFFTFLYYNSVCVLGEEMNRNELLADREFQLRSWWFYTLRFIGVTGLPRAQQAISDSSMSIAQMQWSRSLAMVVYSCVVVVLSILTFIHVHVPKDDPLPFEYCPALLTTIMTHRTEKTTIEDVVEQGQAWLGRVRVLNIPSRAHTHVANATIQVALAVFRLQNFQAWGKLFLVDL